jgi:membrane associated rhomboid family serine protease
MREPLVEKRAWFRWFRVPVGLMFGIWVRMQIVGALWIMQGIGDVAVFAHLGGATVGVLFWWWTQQTISASELQQETS